MTSRLLVIPIFYLAVGFSPVHGQDPHISEKFSRFCTGNLQEKIFMHTDKGSYLTGESLWLSVYYVDGTDHRLLDFSRVVYVELLDVNQKPVIQTKIRISKEGTGNGTIFLPISLASGHYLLRAYTSWMKNFSPDLYFHQVITIINPFTKLPETLEVMDLPKYDVQFFPEGGDLVEGLRSTVAFRAVDRDGRGIDFKGSVVDDQGNTLTTIAPLKFGMGRFELVPEPGRRLKAVITDSDHETFTYNLPEARPQGYALRVSESNEQVKIQVSTNLPNEPQIHILVHTRHRVNIMESKPLEDGELTFTFDKELLQEGVSHITIFNERRKPVCERLFFVRPGTRFEIEGELRSANYTTRERITLKLDATFTGGVGQSKASISVYRMDSLEHDVPTIKSYLLLTSELRGNVESPEYYFNLATPERSLATDNLMLTHGWSRFSWEDVLDVEKEKLYSPELKGQLIHGQSTEALTHEPVSGTLTFLSLIGNKGKTYVSRGDENGRLMFEVEDFYGPGQLVVSEKSTVGATNGHDLQILSPFSQQSAQLVLPSFRLDKRFKQSIEQQSIQMQVQTLFHEKELSVSVEQEVDGLAFYGIPNERYDLDDFTRFKTMEEVLREFVSGVIIRKKDDGWHLYNYDRGADVQSTELFTTNPLVLLDGLPMSNMDEVMALDPLSLKYIEVVTRRYQQGVAIFDGVVHLKSYDGDLAGYQPASESLILEYEGLNQAREFFSPVYETSEQLASSIPDTRNLLFWSPSLNLFGQETAQVEFYTSDIAGTYKVVVQGIDEGGNPGYFSSMFGVTRSVP